MKTYSLQLMMDVTGESFGVGSTPRPQIDPIGEIRLFFGNGHVCSRRAVSARNSILKVHKGVVKFL